MSNDAPVSYTLHSARKTSEETVAEIEILRFLAAGKHPFTGAPLPDESCYQSAKVLRALLAGIKALEKTIREKRPPKKAGAPWTVDEDKGLISSFDEGMSIPHLANKHERTAGAIRSRLEKLGKIAPFLTDISEQKIRP